jgi:thiol:disulfide interchange protein DsbG
MTPVSTHPSPVQRQRLHLLGLPLVAVAAASLAACSKTDDSAQAAAPAGQSGMTPEQAYEKVAMDGKGFVVGSVMSANPVFVLFDPQCPHCGHLWTTSQPLLNKVKFVWIPVSFINGKSAPQGAAILSASDPAEFMMAHETSLLAGTGGAPVPDSMTPEMEATIKANTALFNSLKVESVPYVIAKNLKTGTVVSNAGAMETAALAAFLGI